MSIGVCLATVCLRCNLFSDFYHGKNYCTRSSVEMLCLQWDHETQVFEWHKAFSKHCEIIVNLNHARDPPNSVQQRDR